MSLSGTFNFESEKWDADLAFVMQRLEAVLRATGDETCAQSLPWIHEERDPALPLAPRAVQVYSLAFQLLNMVEENTANQSRRRHELIAPEERSEGSWRAILRELRDAGLGPEEVRRQLTAIEVVPTLTAHPTEAKRASVLEHHRRLYLALVELENQMWTPSERVFIRTQIDASIERLLRTGEVYYEKPDVWSEAQNVRHYLENVFPLVLPDLRRRFGAAWAEVFGEGEPAPDPPRLRFGSWVGGDRDGHPYVTTEVTEQVLDDLRASALALIDEALARLASRLSLSNRHQRLPDALREFLDTHAEALEGATTSADRRGPLPSPDEPWRLALMAMRTRLPSREWVDPGAPGAPGARRRAAGARRRGEGGTRPLVPPYTGPSELLEDLALLEGSLEEVGAHRLVDEDIAPVRELVRAYGFHGASLDLRQNSAYLERAVEQILEASGFEDPRFTQWPFKRRFELLTEELLSRRPLVRRSKSAGDEADEMRVLLRRVAKRSDFGRNRSVEAFVVSMTRDASDLLAALLLAREADFLLEHQGEPASPLPVVPLFETRDDLHASPVIMEAFLGHPYVARSLSLIAALRGYTQPTQEVMLGYSDSCKDAGIIASAWDLRVAQERILEVGRRQGVAIRFFHGRGGTVSRGAGPMERFLAALPPSSLARGVRVTEQGETVSQKYANKLTATFNLEVLVSSALLRGAGVLPDEPLPSGLRAIMDELAGSSAEVYGALLDTEGFVDFFRGATPLDVIERSRIGSRPSRRQGASSLEDLRAIPWVFSWNQARFYLPGWFGCGSALARLRERSPERWEELARGLREAQALYYLFANIETTVHSANEELFSAYAGLVRDEELRERMLVPIREEFRRTRELLDALFHGPFAERRPRLAKTLRMRESPLSALHKTQIERLAAWRDAGGSEEDPRFDELLLITNAIASGLRTTG